MADEYARAHQQLVELATEYDALTKTLEECERIQAESKKRLEFITTKRMPDLMQELGYEDMRLQNGKRVVMKRVVRAGIPSLSAIGKVKDPLEAAQKHHRRALALAWLREHGLGDLIKNEVSVSFPAGSEEDAVELTDELECKGFNVARDETVNTQTLTAQVRDLLQRGEEVPMDILGVSSFDSCEIK